MTDPDDNPEAFFEAGRDWWNALTPAERAEALARAEEALGRPVSPADAFLVHDGSGEAE